MARKLMIGGKSGVSQAAEGLAYALARRARRVLLLTEATLQTPFLLKDAIEGRCRLKQALWQDKVCPSFFALSVSGMAAEAVRWAIEKSDALYDYLFVPEGRAPKGCCDEAIVVATPQYPSVQYAEVLAERAKQYNAVHVLITGYDALSASQGKQMDVFEVFACIGGKRLGVIPQCKTGKEGYFDLIAANLHNGTATLPDRIFLKGRKTSSRFLNRV